MKSAEWKYAKTPFHLDYNRPCSGFFLCDLSAVLRKISFPNIYRVMCKNC